jgi:DNA-binding Lrp family transcriptional regulator
MSEILKLLEQDARLTPDRIAVMTGIPEAEVRSRIAAWEAAGVIRRYKAVIDWDKVGEQKVYAFIDVKVTPAKGLGFDDIAEHICRFPEVRSVHLLSGAQDLRCVVEGRDIREIGDFVALRLAAIDRVTATTTHFLLKRYKEDGEVYAVPEPDQRLTVAP